MIVALADVEDRKNVAVVLARNLPQPGNGFLAEDLLKATNNGRATQIGTLPVVVAFPEGMYAYQPDEGPGATVPLYVVALRKN